MRKKQLKKDRMKQKRPENMGGLDEKGVTEG